MIFAQTAIPVLFHPPLWSPFLFQMWCQLFWRFFLSLALNDVLPHPVSPARQCPRSRHVLRSCTLFFLIHRVAILPASLLLLFACLLVFWTCSFFSFASAPFCVSPCSSFFSFVSCLVFASPHDNKRALPETARHTKEGGSEPGLLEVEKRKKPVWATATQKGQRNQACCVKSCSFVCQVHVVFLMFLELLRSLSLSFCVFLPFFLQSSPVASKDRKRKNNNILAGGKGEKPTARGKQTLSTSLQRPLPEHFQPERPPVNGGDAPKRGSNVN